MHRIHFAIAILLLICIFHYAENTDMAGLQTKGEKTVPENQKIQGISQTVGELRGVWIHSPYGLGDLGWDATIKLLADNGFNAIFPNLLWGYCAEYPSTVLPIHPKQVNDDGTMKDMLKECSDACKKYGVQLHVWKVCLNMGHRTPANLKKQMRDAGRTQQSLKGAPSDFLAPHIQENVDLEIAAFEEIVRKYPVDGIHLDYIRYPGSDYDFSNSARAAFENHLGTVVESWPQDCQPGGCHYDDFCAWRRATITGIVRRVHDAVKAISPDVMVSAAVYTNWESAPVSIGQDPRTWLDENLLDFLCPMDYFETDAEFRDCLEQQLAYTRNRVPFYAGIGAYKLKENRDVCQQILSARQLGADGFICFQLNKSFAENQLPVIHQEQTAAASPYVLHNSPRLDYEISPSRIECLPYGSYPCSAPCNIFLKIPKGTVASSITIHLWRNGTEPADDFLCITPKIGAWELILSNCPPGYYRITFSGRNQEGEQIQSHTQAIRMLSEEETQDAILRNGPPLFAGNGRPKIGIYGNNTYGSASILSFLKSQEQFDAAELNNLNRSSLEACDIIIFPQPRKKTEQFKSQNFETLLRTLILEKGIGVLTTHTLTGANGFRNLAPEIVSKAIMPPIAKTRWKIAEDSPVKKLPVQSGETSFVDYISMEPGEAGHVVATAGTDKAPVIIGGSVGNGFYAACGFGLGIGPGDKDTELLPEEKQLLIHLLKWMCKSQGL